MGQTRAQIEEQIQDLRVELEELEDQLADRPQELKHGDFVVESGRTWIWLENDNGVLVMGSLESICPASHCSTESDYREKDTLNPSRKNLFDVMAEMVEDSRGDC